jgi:hypothetical protein
MKETLPPTNETKTECPSYGAWIGLDWADQKHFWSMRTSDGKLERGELKNTPEAIEKGGPNWVSALLAGRWPWRLSKPAAR